MGEPVRDLGARSFHRDGYLVVRGLADAGLLGTMRRTVVEALDPLQGPAEFEADVGYPGAPPRRDAAGGNTPRRLLHAYSRDPVFREWVRHPVVTEYLRALLEDRDVRLSQCHHNCVMTKHPGYSSRTLWHQDMRYWSFDEPRLVSVWLALGCERADNGALWMIPESHRLDIDRGRLDRDLFLRRDLEENAALIDRAQVVQLEPGDTLFFHSGLFHAAGMNRTDQVKLSAVFTYHAASNRPIPGTRSDRYPSVADGWGERDFPLQAAWRAMRRRRGP